VDDAQLSIGLTTRGRRMLLSTFGTPSALMYGGLNLVRNLTELGIGAHKLANANTTDELRKALAELKSSDEPKVVFYSDLPSAELCALFIKSRAPIVLFVDNFDDVVTYVSEARGMSLPDSVRLASRSFCALEPVIRSELVLKFDARTYLRPIREVLREISEFFGAKLSEASLDHVLDSLVGKDVQASISNYLFGAFPATKPPGSGLQRLSPDDRRIVTHMLKPYSAVAAGQSFDRMDWPVSMFMDSAAPVGGFSGRIELLGPARFLAYGPYLHLTPGRWSAEVVLEIAENHSGNQLYVDAYAGKILSIINAPLAPQGTYRFRISFNIDDALEPVQLRFQTMSGAIEGVITLNRVELTKVLN
jgi:hypothetical protein